MQSNSTASSAPAGREGTGPGEGRTRRRGGDMGTLRPEHPPGVGSAGGGAAGSARRGYFSSGGGLLGVYGGIYLGKWGC